MRIISFDLQMFFPFRRRGRYFVGPSQLACQSGGFIVSTNSTITISNDVYMVSDNLLVYIGLQRQVNKCLFLMKNIQLEGRMFLRVCVFFKTKMSNELCKIIDLETRIYSFTNILSKHKFLKLLKRPSNSTQQDNKFYKLKLLTMFGFFSSFNLNRTQNLKYRGVYKFKPILENIKKINKRNNLNRYIIQFNNRDEAQFIEKLMYVLWFRETINISIDGQESICVVTNRQQNYNIKSLRQQLLLLHLQACRITCR